MHSDVTMTRDWFNVMVNTLGRDYWLIGPTVRRELDDDIDRHVEACALPAVPIGPERLNAIDQFNTRQAVLDGAADQAATGQGWIAMSTGSGSGASHASIDTVLLNRMLTARYVAAIALAMRWYQVDHAGQFPETLEAIVPSYLPTVPVNPLSKQGVPFEYVLKRNALPDGWDRPLLMVDMPDGVPAMVPPLPNYQVIWRGGRKYDPIRGRCSDLTSWTPTQAQIDAETAK